MDHSTHWHIITDCEVMASYTTKEQAENGVYGYMRNAAFALLSRWTQDLMDNGVVSCGIEADEVEGWLIEQCSRPLDECDPVEGSPGAGHGRRLDYFRRTGDDQR